MRRPDQVFAYLKGLCEIEDEDEKAAAHAALMAAWEKSSPRKPLDELDDPLDYFLEACRPDVVLALSQEHLAAGHVANAQREQRESLERRVSILQEEINTLCMIDDATEVNVRHWLVSYTWRRPGGKWAPLNDKCYGCPGAWWANYLEGRKADEEDQCDYTFLGAVPISLAAYEAFEL